MDGSAESFSDQSWNPAAVVKMRVGQNHRVNSCRRNRHWMPVALPPFLGSLEHAAIDEHLKPRFAARIRTGVDQMLRACNGARRAEKLNVGQEFPQKRF